MTVSVGDGVIRPTHDISLTDGTNTVGLILSDSQGNRNPLGINRKPYPRTAMKTTSGNQKYEDFEPPWSPVCQEDWSGGRGYKVFDEDITRYFDARRMNTLFSSKIFCGGQETYCTGYRSQDKNLPGSVQWSTMTAAPYWAVKFTASASYSAALISILVKRVLTPPNSITVELCSDNGGNPGTVLKTATITTTNISDYESEFYTCSITAESLTSTTAYWVKVYSAGGSSTVGYWAIATQDSGSNGKNSADGSAWTAADPIYFRVTTAEDTNDRHLFMYNRAMYFYQNTGGTPKLWMNGYRGVAKTNTANKLLLNDNGTPAWTTNEWAGCVVLIIGGLGSNDLKPWRTIVSNTADVLTCDSAWTTTHDTTTDYVILGSNKWTELSEHGLTVDVTGILENNGNLYVCQGDAVALRRCRWTVSEGAGSHVWAADSTNKAFKLTQVRDGTDGLLIFKANNLDATSNISVACAPIPAVGADMVFETAVTFLDGLGKITGIGEYGDTTKQCWVFRENSIFAMSRTGERAFVPDEIPLKEIHSCGDWQNGEPSLTHGVYYYFRYKEGLERYYNSQLDDVGPNLDEGLPSNRRGGISSLAGYPGKLYAAIDADTTGISSVLANSAGSSGSGWCEVYRAPSAGLRIHSIAFQPIPGAVIDRLWIVVGSDIIWIPASLNPLQDSNYRYVHESTLTTGYMYAGLYEIYKFYHSISGITENLGSNQWIEIDYQLDTNTTWTPLSEMLNTSPSDEVGFSTTGVTAIGVNGKRIRFRYRMQTTSNSTTPILNATVLDNVSRVPVKYSYGIAYRVRDNEVDINGHPDLQTTATKQALLDQWATQLTPLTMRCNFGQFDNKTVFIDPATMQPLYVSDESHEEGHLESFTVIEI